jgi:murein DD-endopeptidase MepM/ murein hydrolase activator NlpD
LKKFKINLKKIDQQGLLELCHNLIEHRLFKPVVISVITSFVLFRGFEFAVNLTTDYQESLALKRANTPIKINLSNEDMKFDLDEDQILEHKVKSGDTITKIMANIGADEQDVISIFNAMKKVFNPKAITVGDFVTIKYRIKIGYDSKKSNAASDFGRKVVINSFSVSPSPEQEIVVSRKDNGEYDAREIKLKLLRYVSRYSGTLKNSLFVDGVEAGISPTSMMNMINLYSYDVDFQRDIKNGDKFEMLVESFYTEDGKKVKDGNVLFSSLTLQNRSIDIYMHKVDNRVEYFDYKGNSVRKSLLRTPINGARVSSGFGLRRHPILGYSKMHKGTDFAAPSGTPILAAGSGIITHYSVKGGYGNFVQIRHNENYSTGYGHASRYVKKLRVGSAVKQGDVIAYVGSTGRSTGPHLHFEVLYKGVQINPSTVKATSGLRLSGKELARFEDSRAEIERYRKNVPNQIQK